MESLDHAILLTLGQKNVIDRLREKIAIKRRWLGPAATEIQVQNEEQCTREEDDLLEAFKLFTEKMDAFRNCVAQREMSLNEIHRSLHNPSETGQIVIRGKRHRNCFTELTPEITQILLKRLACNTENSENSAMWLRKAMFFFDSAMVLSAAKPLWGGIGAALLNRSLGKILFGKGVICTAKDTEGTVVALVRIDTANVVAADADTGNIRWKFDAAIVQNRDGSCAADVATMAFEDVAEFYVINKKRFVCYNGRCTAGTLNPPRVAGNTIRINRFINNVPNRPFYIHPPSFTEVQHEAPPFYIVGQHAQGRVTLQVNAKSTFIVFPQLGQRFYYRPASVSQDHANQLADSVPRYSAAFQDQVSVRRANMKTVFFTMPQVLNIGPQRIEAVARFASFVFVRLRGETHLRIACLPENLYRISSVVAYSDGQAVHAVVVADTTTEDEDVVNVTIFAKLEKRLAVKTDDGINNVKIGKMFSALSSVLDVEAEKNNSALEKLKLKTKIMKNFAQTIVKRPVALTVKNHIAGIARGTSKEAYVQCGTALVRVDKDLF